MNIIAHRGVWKSSHQKNSETAFKQAIDEGYGIETDVREYNGSLVLSHDVADGSSVLLSTLFEYYEKKNSTVILALNVKEDGIQAMVKEMLAKYKIEKYFFFDMSIPEMVVYDCMEMKFFTRESDIEHSLVLYDKAEGVWVDAFYKDWDMLKSIRKHLSNGKKVSLISPEIHCKDESIIWERLKESGICDDSGFFMCTDYPVRAREYFGG